MVTTVLRTRTAPAATHARLAHVQGIRGLAVLVVVLEHAFGWPVGGFTGVDVFFVISGFVITRSLLAEADRTDTVSLRDFVLRRLRRLLPAALLVTVATMVAALFVFYLPRALATLWQGAAATMSVANWQLVRAGTDYFADAAASSPFQHFWSLSVEEQFYAVWPTFLLMLLWALPTRRGLELAVATVVGASFAVACAESALRPAWAYFATESRVWQLGIGVLLAFILARAPRMLAHRAASAVLTLTGTVLLVASLVLVDGSQAFPGPLGLLPTLAAAALITAGCVPRPSRLLAPLIWWPSTRLGDISYSLYLWHYPLIVFAAALWPGSDWSRVVAVAVAVPLATLTYRGVELRFQRTHPVGTAPRTPGRWASLRWGLGAMLVVGTLSVAQLAGPPWLREPPALPAAQPPTTAPFADATQLRGALESALASDRWPARLTPSLDTVDSGDAAAHRLQQYGCLVDPAAALDTIAAMTANCSFGATDAPHTAVVLGDSIAIGWLPAVTAGLGDGWRVIGIGLESCPPQRVTVTDRTDRAGFAAVCDDARARAVGAVQALQPDLVLISGALGSYQRLASRDGEMRALHEWADGTTQTARELASGQTHVVVVTTPPETTPVTACATRVTGPRGCTGQTTPSWTAKTDAENGGATAAGATVLDTAGWFCVNGSCPAFADGTLILADGGHVTETFAERLATVMSDALAGIVR